MRLQKLSTAWFTLEADPDKAEFEIKHLRAGEVARIVEATHKQKFEFRKDEETEEMIPVPVLEISKLDEKELTIFECVVGWKKVFGTDGKAMDCTAENKKRFCNELSEEDFSMFVQFIQDSRQSLSDSMNKETKATEKN